MGIGTYSINPPKPGLLAMPKLQWRSLAIGDDPKSLPITENMAFGIFGHQT
jgi:hypothetical protein